MPNPLNFIVPRAGVEPAGTALRTRDFNQERIRNLPIPEKGRVDYYDTKVPKLTCRVSSTGNKSFVVIKKKGADTVQRIT